MRLHEWQLCIIMSQHIPSMFMNEVMEVMESAHTPEHAAARLQMVRSYFKEDGFIDVLVMLIKLPWEGKLVARQNCANMIDRAIIHRIQDEQKHVYFYKILSCHASILLDWTIPYHAKKLIKNSFQQTLQHWQNELDYFWEIVIESLVKLLAQANNCTPNQELHQEITSSHLCEPLQFSIVVPCELDEVYLTMLMMMEAMFENFSLQSSSYQERLMGILKRVHRLVFNHKFIEQHTQIIKSIIDLEFNFIISLADFPRESRAAMACLANWEQFSADIQILLFMKALPFQPIPGAYNIFLLTQDWETRDLIELKRKALELYDDLMIIMQGFSALTEDCALIVGLTEIFPSVYCSLLWLAGQRRGPSETEEAVEVTLLDNLTLYVANFGLQGEQLQNVLSQIIFPIIVYEIQEHQAKFNDRCEELMKILDDCSDSQAIQERLPAACKLLQQITDQVPQSVEYLRSCIIATLSSKIGSRLSNTPQFFQTCINNLPSLSVEACFLILANIYYHPMTTVESSALRKILTEEAFRSFSTSEKQYFLHFASSSWDILFEDVQACEYIMSYALDEQCGEEVECFAFDFIFNLDKNFYSESFTRQLLAIYPDVHSPAIGTQLVSRMLNFYMNRINEHVLCSFVRSLNDLCQLLIKKKIAAMNSKKYVHDNTDLVRYITIFRQIAHQREWLITKPQLISQLLAVVAYIANFNKFLIDDDIAMMGGDVLSCLKRFPEGFIGIMREVLEVFRASEYKGNSYYYFIGQCLEIINNYNYDAHIAELINDNYNAVIEGFAYFTHFPDELTCENYEELGSLAVLLQYLFILFGDKLPAACVEETHRVCQEMLNRVPQEELVLVGRTHNLMLLCEILSSKQYPLDGLFNLAKNGYYCNNADASLLIFLFGQIRPEVPKEQHLMLVSTVLLACKSFEEVNKQKKKNLCLWERIRKMNSIFSYVAYPIEINVTPLNQASHFFRSYSNQDPSGMDEVLTKLKSIDKSFDDYIHKIANLDDNKGFMNLLFDSEEEKEEEEEEEEEKAENERLRKRKFVHVLGDRAEGEVRAVPAAQKRGMSVAMSGHSQSQGLEKQGKRRKMEAGLSIQKLTKKEIMQEKMSKKNIRI